MEMYGSDSTQAPPTSVSRLKPHQRIPVSPAIHRTHAPFTSEEFVEMHPVSEQCTELCTHTDDVTPTVHRHTLAGNSSDVASPIESNLHRPAERESSVNREVASIMEKLDISVEQSEKVECVEAEDLSGLPPDWSEMSLDMKYTHPAVTLLLLTEERENVTKQLEQLPDCIKVREPNV